MKKTKCLLKLLLVIAMLSMSTGSAWAYVYLPGSWNNFAPEDDKYYLGTNNGSLTMYLTPGTYTFKVYDTGLQTDDNDQYWYGITDTRTMTRGNRTDWTLDTVSAGGTSDCITMIADSAGYYTFSMWWSRDTAGLTTFPPIIYVDYPEYRLRIISEQTEAAGNLCVYANRDRAAADGLYPAGAWINLDWDWDESASYRLKRVTDADGVARPWEFSLTDSLTLWAEYEPITSGAPAGSGTKSDPYQIASFDHLKWLNKQITEVNWYESPVFYARQIADTIFLDQSNFAGVGKSNRPFRGGYDGQGKTILLMSDRASGSHDYYGGVFSCIETCTIKDLNVIKSTSIDKYGNIHETKVSYESSYAESYGVNHTDEAVGTVIGRAMGSSKIINVTSNVDLKINGGGLGGNIPTSHMGGIVGMITGHTEVRGCSYTGNIDAGMSKDCIGGIVGYADENSNTMISHCFAKSTIKTTSTDAGHAYIGGILGYINDDGSTSQFEGVNNCFADVTFDLPSGHTYNKVAAIIGDPRGNAIHDNNVHHNYFIDHSYPAVANGKTVDANTNKAVTINVTVSTDSWDNQGTAAWEYANPHYTDSTSTAPGLTATATGQDYYHLDYWTGSSSDDKVVHVEGWNYEHIYDRNNPKTVILNSNIELIAHFQLDRFSTKYYSSDETMGTVSGPGNQPYPYGHKSTLIATPKTGYHFVKWSDGETEYVDGTKGSADTVICSTNAETGVNTLDFIVTADKTYTAYFAPNAYTVTVDNNYSEVLGKAYISGTANEDGTYDYGTTIKLCGPTVEGANAGYYHFKWWEDEEGNRLYNRVQDVTVTGDKNYSATYEYVYSITGNTLDSVASWAEGALEIPDGVVTVSADAFSGCAVTAVTIPATVITIEEHAFNGCNDLTDITFAPGSRCKSIGADAVYNTTARPSLHLTSLPKIGSQSCLTVASLALTDESYVSTVDGEFSYVTFPGKGTRTYTRQMTNEWGTAVLPFTVRTNSEVQLYSIVSISCPTDGNEEEGTEPAGTITLSAVSDTIQANRPFVFRKKNPNATSVTFTDIDSVRAFIPHYEENSFTISEVGVKLIGTYIVKDLDACQGENEESECTSTNYFIAQDAFWRADGGVTIPPFRAWFDFSGYTGCGQGNNEEDGAPARFIIAESQTPTGLTPSDSSSREEGEKISKLLIDGRMYILRGENLYDMNGRKY